MSLFKPLQRIGHAEAQVAFAEAAECRPGTRNYIRIGSGNAHWPEIDNWGEVLVWLAEHKPTPRSDRERLIDPGPLKSLISLLPDATERGHLQLCCGEEERA